MNLTTCLPLIVLTAAAFDVVAGTNGFVNPPFRGSSLTERGYWESFTAAVGGTGNVTDRPGSTTGAVLSQLDSGAFLTGSGNIYNLNGTNLFTLSDTTPFELGTVVLQARTIGGEVDYGSMLLTYSNGTMQETLAPLPRVELDRGSQPGVGATVSSVWQWNLTGLGITSYVITFRAAKNSSSFDAMTLDTAAEFRPLFSQPFAVTNTLPSIERWMYANNAAPCDRPAGAVFATFGDASPVDTRHAQHLVGWDTASLVPTNHGASRYIINRCRLTLTINRGNIFAYDPTQDEFRTYFEPTHSGYLTDQDAGRPIELFGVGFRNGFTAATFDQCALFGANTPGQRNAYAAGFSTNGVLVDVSNNVGKTNAAFPRFEVRPFAIAQTTSVLPGQMVPSGARMTFDLNLDDPLVRGYVQSALQTGTLRLMVSSLHANSGQFGNAAYPDFATHFNDAVIDPTSIEMEGVAIGSSDLDKDALPDDWELHYFNTLAHSAANDVDGDGTANSAELRAGTNPASKASVLRLTTDRTATGSTTLRFAPVSSCRYSVEFADNIGTWQRITNTTFLYPTRNSAEWTDNGLQTGGAGAKRFYRLVAE